MVIITVDDRQRPVLISPSINTCSCNATITPTTELEKAPFPQGREPNPVMIYGETLLGILNLKGIENSKLLVHIRPDVHRVMDLYGWKMRPDKVPAYFTP